jgi:hypothetical protein
MEDKSLEEQQQRDKDFDLIYEWLCSLSDKAILNMVSSRRDAILDLCEQATDDEDVFDDYLSDAKTWYEKEERKKLDKVIEKTILRKK